MKKNIFTLSAIVLSLAMTSCATTKVDPAYLQELEQKRQMLKQAPVAILSNTCFITNELGRDQILLVPSQQSADKFTQILKTELSQNGVQVAKSATPLICGYMPEEQFKKYDVKADEKEKRNATTTYPLVNPSDQSLTPEQQKAVLMFNQYAAATAKIEAYNQIHKKSPKPLPELSDETASSLKTWSQSNYVVLADLNGLDATIGHKFSMGALSLGVSLVTLNMGAGLITSYVPREGQTYNLRVFDLEKKLFVWNKSGTLQGNAFSYKNHSLSAKNVLAPLFKSDSE